MNNTVKTALLEKNIPFEAVFAPPSQEPAYLAKSPMGKIPCIETEAGFIAIRTLKKRGRVVVREVPVPANLFASLDSVHGIDSRASPADSMQGSLQAAGG